MFIKTIPQTQGPVEYVRHLAEKWCLIYLYGQIQKEEVFGSSDNFNFTKKRGMTGKQILHANLYQIISHFHGSNKRIRIALIRDLLLNPIQKTTAS